MRIGWMVGAAWLAVAGPAGAQEGVGEAAEAASGPVTVESHYRIRWGAMGDFMDLYRRNHEPVLQSMRARGFIVDYAIEGPFTHMAGEGRWDLRVTITYRDPEAALGDSYASAAAAEMDRLYTDVETHTAEEARRFGLVEEHWDVVVVGVE